MTYLLSITHDLLTPKTSRAGYHFDLSETDEAVRPLTQIGSVENNQIAYNGVYRSAGDAIAALAAYVDAPAFTVVR